jgi:8-oxo-dGTP pyrophosphatase MutT (NUDIX family)
VDSDTPFEIVAAGDPRLAPRFDDLASAEEQLRQASLNNPSTEAAREQILGFTATHRGAPEQSEPNALHRGCLAGHLTGSALVVDATGERTLLLHHAKLDRWLQPGGHADGDGNLAAVALKEATEETGIPDLRVVLPALDIDVHTIPARPGEPEHLHLDVRFLVLAPEGAAVHHNEESHDARWASADDPAIVGSEELSRAVNRAIDVAGGLV